MRWAGGWQWLGAFAGVVLIGLLLRVPSLFEPMWYADEGYFASIADGVRAGGVLYGDHWDLKPPMIFWTYAGVQTLFGTSVAAIHAASIAALLVVYGATAFAARELGSPARAVVAAVVVTVCLGGPLFEGNLALTENFMIAFTALAACTWLLAIRAEPSRTRTWLFLATGLLFGIAANYKQVALWDAAAFGLMTLVAIRRPWRPIVQMAGAGLLMFVPFVLYALLTSSLPEYWEAVAGFLGPYAETAPRPQFVLRTARYLPLALMVAWVVLRRVRGGTVPLTAFAPLWLAAAFAGSLSSTYPFAHYLMQVVPALALTLAFIPWRSAALSLPEWVLRGAMAVVMAGTAFWVVDRQYGEEITDRGREIHRRYYLAFFDRMSGDIDAREAADRLGPTPAIIDDVRAAMTVRDDDPTLFAWGHLPWIYAATGYTNSAKHYSSFTAAVMPETLDEIRERIEKNPPDYVLVMTVTDVPFPWLDSFLEAHYGEVEQQKDWTLYLRDDLQGDARTAAR